MEIKELVTELSDYCRSYSYAGHDPYDALNSPLIQRLTFKNKYLRIIATQLVRRSPINIRPLLGIQKGENPKGIGLFLWGYTKLHRMDPKKEYKEEMGYLFSRLEALESQGYSGSCWGYNFDWQSRTFFRPKGTPTIVNTSFIGHALLDAYETFGEKTYLEKALSIRHFMLKDLKRTRLDEDSFCFSYTPVDTAVVHNANMLGASLLIRLYAHCREEEVKVAALSALSYSMKHQREDGSWYYADTFSEKWIDSFHTGFNLQALRWFIQEGHGESYREAYNKGVDYYASNFFLEDGTPKYFHNQVYPIDVHAPAQAIVFFSGEGEEYRDLTEGILRWTVRHLYSGEGWFYFQKNRHWMNRISYMRWTQAWAFHSLTEYLRRKTIT
ncbi:hypothetical protein OOT00_13825 [Desulfobotulus sp. H1]|uniref:Delta-aminolevulinic acid dehydratase n=1 Tax=Desulfobotulus pelophilus TaxID=2823377 RepID=A0ABT3NC69_9BACT|nr:hypothetical protein [Desulfobotulus pelophilus]MCW7755063.1 hypothetical protein [Desulfobotulus pelophilus]